MRLDEELARLAPEQDTMLTIGVFDGVHRGHRHLVAQLVHEAVGAGCIPGVLTFRNHPASVLRADFQPQYLTTLEERVSLLEELGVALIIPVTFDEELSYLSARDFIMRIKSPLRMRGLVVGPDFALGHRRDGDVAALTALGEELGYSVRTVELLSDNDEAVRSTTIRRALADGDVSLVADMLGRNFRQSGVVVRGAERGRTLGFPTANVEAPPGMAIPADGIYATFAYVGDERHMAATSIGIRPTFDDQPRAIEAFLLDFSGDLYGKQIRLEYVRRLREELKYDSVEALLEQIQKDVDQARAVLEAVRSEP